MPEMASSTESLLANLRAEVRAEILAELQHMTFAQIIALLHGTRAAAATNTAPKRGPGRPKKIAAGQVPNARPTAGRQRRSVDDLKRVVTKMASLLADNPSGLSSEEIQKALGIKKAQLTGPIALGLSEGTFSKKGERRGTKYFVRAGKTGGGDGKPAK